MGGPICLRKPGGVDRLEKVLKGLLYPKILTEEG
jgi:hypothetical protein